MVRKALSICFLFLAGTILLGHAIIPHHHQIILEVIDSVVKHHHDHDSRSLPEHSHEHNGGKNVQFVLDQLIVFRTAFIKPDKATRPLAFYNIESSHLFIHHNCFVHQLFIPGSALFRRTDHEKLTFHCSYYKISLRGPPVA